MAGEFCRALDEYGTLRCTLADGHWPREHYFGNVARMSPDEPWAPLRPATPEVAALLAPQPPPGEVAGARPVWDLVREDLERLFGRPGLLESGAALLPVVPLVLRDAKARDAQGRAKYGVPLQPNNGRDALIDAYQEALDLCAYLRQALAERKPGPWLLPLYGHALSLVVELRSVLFQRDGR